MRSFRTSFISIHHIVAAAATVALLTTLTSQANAINDGFGELVVIERGSGQLSIIASDGTVTELASGFQDGLDVDLLPNGELIVSERVTTSFGNGFLTVVDPDNGNILESYYPGFSPNDLFVDDNGDLYVTSYGSGVFLRPHGTSTFTLVSGVPGDVTDIVRVGSFLYTVNVACLGGPSGCQNSLWRIDPSNTDASTNYAKILSGLSNPLGVAAFGSDLLVSEFKMTGRVLHVTNIEMPMATASVLLTGVSRASSFTPDGEGGFFLSQQKDPGSIVHLDATGTMTPFITNRSDLSSPRGMVSLGRCAENLEAVIVELLDNIAVAGIHHGTTVALTQKLQAAVGTLTTGSESARQDAVNHLEAFINQLEALSGKKVDEGLATLWIEDAKALIDCLTND